MDLATRIRAEDEKTSPRRFELTASTTWATDRPGGEGAAGSGGAPPNPMCTPLSTHSTATLSAEGSEDPPTTGLRKRTGATKLTPSDATSDASQRDTAAANNPETTDAGKERAGDLAASARDSDGSESLPSSTWRLPAHDLVKSRGGANGWDEWEGDDEERGAPRAAMTGGVHWRDRVLPPALFWFGGMPCPPLKDAAVEFSQGWRALKRFQAQ
eukprot:jgi/Mesvir1/10424/Mv12688-RA.1